MDKLVKNLLGLAVILALFLLVFAAFWYVAVYSRSILPERTFAVTGEGEVVTVPDVAEFTYITVTEGELDLDVLQEANAGKINKANSFVKESGVDEKDIKTTSYSITPRYQYYRCDLLANGEPCPPREIVGYAVRQSVSVKVRDFSVVGDILSGVVERGVNSISGLSFSIDDLTEARNEARKEAMKKARDKAKAIAKAGGFGVGRLISVRENNTSPYQPVFRADFAEASVGGGVPSVEPGSEEVRVNVTLTYEIR